MALQPMLLSFAGEEQFADDMMGWNPLKAAKGLAKKAIKYSPPMLLFKAAKYAPPVLAYKAAKRSIKARRVGFHGEELLGISPKQMIQMKRRAACRGKPDGVDAFGLSTDSIYYYQGEDGQVYLGKGKFLPGLKKGLKKVGKFTSPITGAIAKSFLPAGVVNALSNFDPTRKGGASSQAASTALATIIKPVAEVKAEKMTSPEIDALKKTALDPKVLAIAGGGALVLLLMMMKKR